MDTLSPGANAKPKWGIFCRSQDSIWPMLWNCTPENSIIVEKEVVQLTHEPPDPEPLTETETEFPAEFSSLAL